MRRITKLLWTILILSSTAHSEQAQIGFKDFAYAMPIYLHGMNSTYEVNIPYEVYHRITQVNLGDIRIFNSKDQLVTYAIHAPKSTLHTKSEILPFFPIYGATDNLNNLKMRVKHDRQGTIVSVDTSTQNKATKHLTGYLIDVQKIQRKNLKEILVEWETKNKNWINQVKLSVSNDLANWQYYHTNSSLADLDYAGNQIIRKAIDVSKIYDKYLMLQWNNKEIDFQVKKLTAEVIQRSRDLMQWQSYFNATNSIEDQQKGIYEYAADSYIPVTQVNISMPQQNTLATANFYYRNDPKADWIFVTTHNIFDLKQKGGVVKNEPAAVSLVRGRYWKVKITPEETNRRGTPALLLGWRPEQLVFLATGSPPFRLAYGSGRVTDPASSQDLLLQQIKTNNRLQAISKATMGAEYIVSGELALRTLSKPTSMKVIILWVILIGGVCVVGAMALSLMKQMKD